MNDSSDGSSSAAHGAQGSEMPQNKGLLARLKWALNPPPVEPDRGASQPARRNGTRPEMPVLGLGNLRRMRVEDVAIPKVEIVSVPSDIDKDGLVEVFRDSGLTRLPVYDGTLDSPLGMVHLKDVALKHGFNGTSAKFSLKPMLRPLIYAPPSMPIGVLLQRMQSERIHMALVIDEYGGTDGLVTIENLIEQVIGEIEDEHDAEEEAFWTIEKPGCYLVWARAPLDEFEAEIGVHLADEDSAEEVDTLGGIAFMLSGRVPTRGEVMVHPTGIEIEVVDADARRIKRLRVRLPESKTPQARPMIPEDPVSEEEPPTPAETESSEKAAP